jgi:hypothetical protein
MTIRVLDPTFEDSVSTVASLNRLTSLIGCSVGLLDNGKPRAREFFDHLEHILRSQYGVANVLRFAKPDASRPAPVDLIATASRSDAVISGVGD